MKNPGYVLVFLSTFFRPSLDFKWLQVAANGFPACFKPCGVENRDFVARVVKLARRSAAIQ